MKDRKPQWEDMTEAERNAYINQDQRSFNGDVLMKYCTFDPRDTINEIPESAKDIFADCIDAYQGEVHFDCLSVIQNRALTLFYFEGMALKEIGIELEMEWEAVKKSIYRATLVLGVIKQSLVPKTGISRAKQDEEPADNE